MNWGGRFPQVLVPLFAVLTLPVGILVALFASLEAAAVVFVVGWLLLVPASAILFGAPDEETIDRAAATDRAREPRRAEGEDRPDGDPIERLRDRYARGEIDEAELERRLEALVELEDVDAADEAGIERALERLDAGDAGGRTRPQTGAGSDVGTERTEEELERE